MFGRQTRVSATPSVAALSAAPGGAWAWRSENGRRSRIAPGDPANSLQALAQPIAVDGEVRRVVELSRRDVRGQRHRQPADQAFGAPVEFGLSSEL